MNARQILLFGVILGLIFAPETVCGAENEKIFEPTEFQTVFLPELTPEEEALLEETFHELKNGAENPRASFEVFRGFLVMKSEKFLREKEDFNPLPSSREKPSTLLWNEENPLVLTQRKRVSEKGRDFLKALPPETLLAWRAWVDENVEAALNSIRKSKDLPTPEELKRLIRENPFSSYEAEFWELLAQNAWQTGNAVSAAAFWTKELQVRDDETESRQKTFFLKELPPIETLVGFLKAAENAAQNGTENAAPMESAEQNLQPGEAENRKTVEKREPNPQSEEAENLESGPQWRVSMTRIVSPEGETVFEDLLPEEQRGMLFPDRNRNLDVENEETPQFLTFSPDRNFLIARLGTRVSVWPEEEREARPQPYLVVLDLSRGGQLVWMKAPISVNSAFIGNPLADAEHVYIPTLRLGKNAQISVDVYSLSDGTLQRSVSLFEVSLAEIQNPANETIFLPIKWMPEGEILAGHVMSGVQMVVD